MTGFASLTRDEEPGIVALTVRAVNHRFLDIQLRMPSGLAGSESRLRALIQQRVARGRVEVSVSVQSRTPGGVEVEVNDSVLDAFAAAFERARERGLVTGALAPGDLLRIPQAITVRDRSTPDAEADERVQAAVEAALGAALEELDAMRVREGAHLRAELDGRRAQLSELFERAAAAAEAGIDAFRSRLADRVRELHADGLVEEAALAQEIVRFAARSDITEELVRFRAHLAHWQALSDAPEPCGRKLDFLLQEMNREVNTLGSKAEGPGAPELVVSLKAELEKMREQVQNVE
ncbi:MAG TPA: YicC/YloC family endoribonuclease [Vicinamibacterales bacterium]|nr:YicC/YloC family endoribonuclease [Vicinamibacterales bacterium]